MHLQHIRKVHRWTFSCLEGTLNNIWMVEYANEYMFCAFLTSDKDTFKKAFLSYIVDRKISCFHSFVPRMSCCELAVMTLAEKSQTSHIFWCYPCSAYHQEALFVIWSEPLRVLMGFPGRLLIDCHHNDLIPEIDTRLKEDPQLFITWVCADPHHKRKKMT